MLKYPRGKRIEKSYTNLTAWGLGRDGKLESTNGISRLRKYPLYSRCWRKAIKLGSVKVSLVEQMRRSLRARRKGIVRLVCMGWHEEFSKYWCL